jgi:hypothetical protein
MKKFLLAAALLCGVSATAYADTPNETFIKTIASKVEFNHVFYDVMNKAIANHPTVDSSDPASIGFFCVPSTDDGQRYCHTEYDLADGGPDTLQVNIDIMASGEVARSISTWAHGKGGLTLDQDGSLRQGKTVNSKYESQIIRERFVAAKLIDPKDTATATPFVIPGTNEKIQ